MKLPHSTFAKRALLVGLIAGSGLLGVSAMAASTGGHAGKPGCEAGHDKATQGKWEAKRAAHLSALKEKLRLQPNQAGAWNAFAQASQPGMHHLHGDRHNMRDEMAKLTAPQRMDRMLAMSDQRRAHLMARSQAVKVFYAQLTPQQQSVFDAESLPKSRHGHVDHRG